MKKRKPKSRKICRKKGQNELDIDIEHQKQVNALATQFKEDKFKAVLRRCYGDVQKYGPEAIMKAVEDSWAALAAAGCQGIVHGSSDKDAFVKMEEEVKEHSLRLGLAMDENAEVESRRAYGTSHDHEETSKRNALFLIESSENLPDYDSDTLMEMKQAYKKRRYDDVADLAYLFDCRRRPLPQPPERDTTLHRETPESPWHRVSELLEEVAEEEQHKESPIKCCVEAVRQLSRDLTYDNNAAAKESIRKAIKYLE